MKAKLIKKGDVYFLDVLKTDGYFTIANSLVKSNGLMYDLSLKNCQAIELGYDLDQEMCKLVDKKAEQNNTVDLNAYAQGCLDAFQKSLELMGDKKFSEDDVISMIEKSRETGLTAEYLILTKQQTEWDVEIEMEDAFQLKKRAGGITNMGKPKLDADGCLILRKK